MKQKYNYIMPCHKISPAKKHVDLYLSIRWMVDSIRMDVLFARFYSQLSLWGIVTKKYNCEHFNIDQRVSTLCLHSKI